MKKTVKLFSAINVRQEGTGSSHNTRRWWLAWCHLSKTSHASQSPANWTISIAPCYSRQRFQWFKQLLNDLLTHSLLHLTDWWLHWSHNKCSRLPNWQALIDKPVSSSTCWSQVFLIRPGGWYNQLMHGHQTMMLPWSTHRDWTDHTLMTMKFPSSIHKTHTLFRLFPSPNSITTTMTNSTGDC